MSELCPHSGDGYKFVCRYVADGECNATLRQSLACPLNTPEDTAAIRDLLAKTEGAFRG